MITGEDMRRSGYEYTNLEFPVLRERRHTVDLDIQHHVWPLPRHEVVWGGAYRFSYDDVSERGTTALDPSNRSGDTLSESQEGSSARNHVFVRNSTDLPHDLELDAIVRYVDSLPDRDVDSYVELDLRLGWRFWEDWEIAVVGQNLLREHHQEAAGPDRVQRGVYGQLARRWGKAR